jgi:hypothetical protein
MENFTTHTLENNVITVLIETAWSNLHSQCPFFYSLQAGRLGIWVIVQETRGIFIITAVSGAVKRVPAAV